MLGYVECAYDELKLKEIKQYKAYYCGVCHSLGKINGFSRITLTHDAVFYALLTDVCEKGVFFQEKRCILRARRSPIAIGECVNNAALINILLFINKINDDICDKQPYKRIMRLPFITAYKKACSRAEYAVRICDEKLNMLNNLERSGCDSVDECAEAFAQMCAELCCPDFVVNKDAEIIYYVGYYVAKWVYIIDAVDDLQNDINKRLYNPILQAIKSGKLGKGDVIDFAKEKLDECLYHAELASELLPQSTNSAIVKNIACYGLKNVTDRIILKSDILFRRSMDHVGCV